MPTIKKNLFYYFKILRLNHWFKNLVVLFGTIAAIAYFKVNLPVLVLMGKFFLAFLLACLISSVNYIVNGITDKKTDSHHPVKNQRVILYKKISKRSLFAVATILLLGSLFIAIVIYGFGMFISLLSLFIAGIFYNVRPLRLKDRPFLDVISESINNPIRILIGWFAISKFLIFPPVSLLLLFWASGAVLMSAKRYAELKLLLGFHKENQPSLYRASYRVYNLPKIFFMVLFYLLALTSLFIFFSFKFERQLLVSLPIIFGFFIWFLIIMKEKDSPFREPESVFAKKPLFFLTTFMILLLLVFLALLD